jgi:hypothetical protein
MVFLIRIEMKYAREMVVNPDHGVKVWRVHWAALGAKVR